MSHIFQEIWIENFFIVKSSLLFLVTLDTTSTFKEFKEVLSTLEDRAKSVSLNTENYQD
jgi:hypothetical protein